MDRYFAPARGVQVVWEAILVERGAETGPGDRPRGGARRGQDQCGQATKGVWGMSWHQEATKGVEHCEKPGGAVNER